MLTTPNQPVQPLTGEKEAVYRGNSLINDYANDTYRHMLVSGCIYKLILQDSWSGSVLIGGIEKDGVQLIQNAVKPSDSTAFRYYFRSGFEADWQLSNS